MLWFVSCLITAARRLLSRVIERLMTREFERIWMETFLSQLRCYSVILLEEGRKVTKTLGVNCVLS